MDHKQAQESAAIGIERSAANANRTHSGWVEEASEALGWAATQFDRGVEFTVEQLRQLCSQLPEPPDLRSWGAATQKATKRGYIVKTGNFALAASSNNSPKPLYQAGVWR